MQDQTADHRGYVLGKGGALWSPDSKRSVAGGREAPLDLIEEHLTDIPFEIWRNASTGGEEKENWYVLDGQEPSPSSVCPVLKIQKFAAGGFEATCRMVDLEKIAHAMTRSPRRGRRSEPVERSEESIVKAGSRARRKVRLLVKNMGATNLVTLTRRESVQQVSAGNFWSEQEWSDAWDKLRRNLRRILGDFPYVGVLEPHDKGNFHLHIAWVGKVNVKLMRRLWWGICGGAGTGNVDSQYIKTASGADRSAKIARYISKYVTKRFEEEGRFNKKRYWASRQSIEEAKRYLLNHTSVIEVLTAYMGRLGLSSFADRNFFQFPDGSGWWFAHLPGIHDKGPPPF
jgi:hypothetical protein